MDQIQNQVVIHPKELTVQFVPSQNADTLEAKAKPLEKLLSDKLGFRLKYQFQQTTTR